jgi:hypothetical protein
MDTLYLLLFLFCWSSNVEFETWTSYIGARQDLLIDSGCPGSGLSRKLMGRAENKDMNWGTGLNRGRRRTRERHEANRDTIVPCPRTRAIGKW